MKRKNRILIYGLVLVLLSLTLIFIRTSRWKKSERLEASSKKNEKIKDQRINELKIQKENEENRKQEEKKRQAQEIAKKQDMDLIPKDKVYLKRQQEANHRPLGIPTYIADNNHCLHPSVLYDEKKSFGYPWIMAFTPYSFMKDETENPSLVVSEDGISWWVPEGMENPLVGRDLVEGSHYSDTELVMVDGVLELWYRQTDKLLGQSRLLRKKSEDLIHWSEEEVIFDYGQGGNGFIAPSVIYNEENKEYSLYYRNHANLNREGYIVRKSKDLLNWTEEEEITFSLGEEWQDFYGWHVEFNKIGEKYYALDMAFPDMLGRDGRLFVLESQDGKNFQNPILVEEPTQIGYKSRSIYKSTFAVKDQEIYLYYSAIGEYKENYIALLKGPNFYDLKKVDGPNGHH